MTLLAGCGRPPRGNDAGAVPVGDMAPPDMIPVAPASPCGKMADLEVAFSRSPLVGVMGIVDISLRGADSVIVEYGDDEGYGMATPRFALDQGKARVPVLGLLPGSTAHARAIVYCKETQIAESSDMSIETGLIPGWALRPVVVTPAPPATLDPSVDGYVLLSTQQASNQKSINYLFDRAGRVMWYWDYGGQNCWSPDIQRQPNGHFTVADGMNQSVYLEIDLLGDVKRRFSDTNATLMTDPHEALIANSGNTLLLGSDQRQADCSKWLRGGGVVPVWSATIDEFSPDGATVFHWSSFPEITLDETLLDTWSGSPPTGPVDLLHANSLWVDPVDGNYVVSFRNADAVVKVDRATQKVVWRLGGTASDFTMVNDPQGPYPMGGFSHQHFARYTPAHTLLLFDDGNLHDPPLSRALEYDLDETNMIATVIWSAYYPGGDTSSRGGSAERLPSGNTLISWPEHPSATEVDHSGQILWEMTSQGSTFYRALYLPTAYPGTLQ